MRAPVGQKIRKQRKSLGLSQSGLAQSIGISPSYLNLIEGNKRDVGGTLLHKIAAQLDMPLDRLTGESEQRLLQELEEGFTDPIFSGLGIGTDEARDLVAHNPKSAAAVTRLYRLYADASARLEAHLHRLQSDPLFSQLLHQVLSQITAVRSSAEILEDVDDLPADQSARFVAAINREAKAMSDVARTLIGHFDQTVERRRSVTPARELDDLIINARNYFPKLEDAAEVLRAELDAIGPFGESTLEDALATKFGIKVVRGGAQELGANGFPGQYRYDEAGRFIWFQGSTTVATRQFQLARLYCEFAAPDVINTAISDPRLTTAEARRLAARALGSYMAGALILPYHAVLRDAETNAYDIDFLAQRYNASFEQIAHRLVTLRRDGEEGIPFGFLRSDPAGRLTKHFPLPGLLLPNSGHACPLWAIYAAFRTPAQATRQVVRFADGSRYLFVAKTVTKRLATFRDQPFHSSVMLACDILHADRTIYGQGLDLNDQSMDVPVGPACRLCVQHACAHRQEEALEPGGRAGSIRASFVPQRFETGDGG